MTTDELISFYLAIVRVEDPALVMAIILSSMRGDSLFIIVKSYEVNVVIIKKKKFFFVY